MEKDMKIFPKQEVIEGFSVKNSFTSNPNRNRNWDHIPTIDICSSDSDSDGEAAETRKKRRVEAEDSDGVLPLGFLDPLTPSTSTALLLPAPAPDGRLFQSKCKQFWKAGDYEAPPEAPHFGSSSDGMDHVRVHPKFLHSNATSHKWVLGAFAELLDNSMDEVCNGATYVNIDMILNKKDGSKMLLIEDDGGGMNPDKMRHCMSLGYSAKSKIADTIGQYGNGFKTSTMRLGADVIVFSRSCGKDGNRPTESVGLLSYTFLMSTGKEDIVVPMLDYEKRGQEWSKILRSSIGDWNKNVETIVQWSPFRSEGELLRQFNQMKGHGTRIIIYNLWEDDQGQLELDFDEDPHDIQTRGGNRDEKNIQMAKLYPNSRHFLTYRHSLRNYASILYLRIPPGFRIILRGKDVEHHNTVNDLMMTQEVTYRPQNGGDGVPKDTNMVATVTIGFVKDAKAHIDVQGFNVYHKNRLIKPFWRLWHAPGSDGRGVIGVLEANFVEPAHDKQGFERTIVLQRLETKLVQMQKTYWSTNCHKIGYAVRRNKKALERELYPDKTPSKRASSSDQSSPSAEYVSDDGDDEHPRNGHSQKFAPSKRSSGKGGSETMHTPTVKGNGNSDLYSLRQLREENRELRERLKRTEEEVLGDLLQDLQNEKDKCKLLKSQLEEATRKIETMNKEHDALVDVFAEERLRRDTEEEKLRKKLKDASNTIQELLNKVKLLEKKSRP